MSSLDAATLFGVKGLVAVITGGGTGIGLMAARALEANGATVYIIGRRLSTLQAAASQSQYGKIIPLQGDVTSSSSLSEIVTKLEKEVGYINVLFANSGISGPTIQNLPPNPSLKEYREHLLKFSAEDLGKTFEVNTTGVFLCVVQLLELLDAGNRKGNVEMKSQVIATSSIGGLHRMPIAGSYAYSASKAGTTHMMKQFATAFVPYGIRANILAPGVFPSEMATPVLEHMASKNGGKLPKTFVPAERAGNEEDMAGAVLYLCSKAGAYLNGNVLVVDGGRVGVLPSNY